MQTFNGTTLQECKLYRLGNRTSSCSPHVTESMETLYFLRLLVGGTFILIWFFIYASVTQYPIFISFDEPLKHVGQRAGLKPHSNTQGSFLSCCCNIVQ